MTGTGLRDDTILGAIRLDWWAASDWNGARNTFGIPGRLRRNPQNPTRDPRTTLMVPVIEPSLDRAIDALRKAVATRPQRTAADP